MAKKSPPPPLISVIIPVYKTEKYLSRCLDSVLEQSYQNLEILIVNDASPDHSQKIIDRYVARDGRIRVFQHERNKGLSAARNTALSKVCGELVMFLDSDDHLHEKYIETLVPISLKNDLDILLGAVLSYKEGEIEKASCERYFTPDFRGIGERHGNLKLISNLQENLRKHPRLITFTFPSTAFGKLYKRSLLDDKIFPEGLLFEDESSWVEILFRAKNIGYYDDKKTWVWYLREREGSITGSRGKNPNHVPSLVSITYITEQIFMHYAPELIAYAWEKNISMFVSHIIKQEVDDPTYFDMLEKLGTALRDYVSKIDEAQIKSSELFAKDYLVLYIHKNHAQLNGLQCAFLVLKQYTPSTHRTHYIGLRGIVREIWRSLDEKSRKSPYRRQPKLLRIIRFLLARKKHINAM